MTDILSNSRELRARGENLRSEIDRHAKEMYDSIEREEQRLYAELQQLGELKRRFGWVAPVQSAGNQATERGLQRIEDDLARASQRRAIGVVSGNQGGTGGRSDG